MSAVETPVRRTARRTMAKAVSSIGTPRMKNGMKIGAKKKNVWPLIESGKIKPVIHSTFPAADAAQAHALMESNQHVGKIVLTW